MGQQINLAMVLEKTTLINKIFPEYFAENKENLFREILKVYGDDIGKYKIPETMNFAQEQGLAMAQAAAGKKSAGAGGGQGGRIGDLTGSDSNNKISELVGQ